MNKVRFLAKALVHGAIDWSGRPYRRRRQLCGKLIILTYHSFCTDWPRGLFSSLPVDRFERQIRFLRKNFKLVSLAQGLDHLQHGRVDDQPWLSITIDDGFRDNYTHAWPVLQRYAVPATIFLATDFIDTGRPPWPTQLVEILESTHAQMIESPFKAELNTLDARSKALRTLMAAWSWLVPADRFETLAALRRHLRVGETTRYPSLTWDQIHEMRLGGIRFGSHTVYHSILSDVSDDTVAMEIKESRKRLEEKLQVPCLEFAYPNGNFDIRAKRLLAAEGFRLALTQVTGVNDMDTDALSLFRVEIPYHDPMPTFRARVSGGLWSS